MLRTTSTVCICCRQTFLRNDLWKRSIQSSAVLQRQKSKRKPAPPTQSAFRKVFDGPANRHVGLRPQRAQPKTGHSTRRINPEEARQRLNEGMYRWARLPATLARLRAMGLSMGHAKLLLETFVEERPKTAGGWFPSEEDDKWQMQRIQDDMFEGLPRAVDRALTRRFMAWAVETSLTRGTVPPSVYSTLAAVQNAVNYTHPEEWYPVARMLRRKIHMHVGPTNSGKTHNALRALAASGRGVYASPLRLLAYEVFDRLNKGRIVPLNADPSAPPETFKRACNLVTGEEIRKVDEDAPLLSCTVEMLDTTKRYDVAVVDEIQMISDPERGGAWSTAVLGLHAEEIHLCGEAGAVPLIQEMLKEAGDELIVHRYERLSPLVVASQSLRGDLRKIEKGDCVVSFSRSTLFNIKQKIEETTGMRCAIIYGRLPPEVRSEQAELFNDPNSGYDVLVGSDAIGMGLNLKIKRIVFENTWKWDGVIERVLSHSQLKQIAGRAGRFGLHGDDSGGIVTTLYESDLPIVRKAIEAHAVPLFKRAILPTTRDMFHSLEQLIRPRASFSSVFDILRSAACTPPHFTLREYSNVSDHIVPMIDRFCSDYTLEERLRFMQAPVQWRDTVVAIAMEKFLKMYKKNVHVRLLDGMKGLGIVEALEKIKENRAAEKKKSTSSLQAEEAIQGDSSLLEMLSLAPIDSPDDPRGSILSAIKDIHAKSQPAQIDALLKLESLYRVLVVYMWFSMRLPLAFSERGLAVSMKEECEEAIEWCLARVESERKLSSRERKEMKWKERKEREGSTRARRGDGLDDAEPSFPSIKDITPRPFTAEPLAMPT